MFTCNSRIATGKGLQKSSNTPRQKGHRQPVVGAGLHPTRGPASSRGGNCGLTRFRAHGDRFSHRQGGAKGAKTRFKEGSENFEFYGLSVCKHSDQKFEFFLRLTLVAQSFEFCAHLRLPT